MSSNANWKKTKKRSLLDLNEMNCQYNLDRLPKKQKLNQSSSISSKLFIDPINHQQFQQIFQLIDGTVLIQELQINHIITKQIAEYATGKIKHCANHKCNKEISILMKDLKIYDDNHDNAYKVGFKYCYHPQIFYGQESEQFYCRECMEFAVTKDKGCPHYNYLYFEPDCDKCCQCNCIISICHCPGDDYPVQCSQCKSKLCGECVQNEHTFSICIHCNVVFCGKCNHDIKRKMEWNRCVCNKCDKLM